MNRDHNNFMTIAVRLAASNVENGGGPFGAIIVKDGKLVAKGVNKVTSNTDPTAHAEIEAIRKACSVLESHDLSGCAIYTSCEPCPMCLSAIYWSHISEIYYSATKEQAAYAGFMDDLILDELRSDKESRLIPMRRILHEEADRAFRKWAEIDSKVAY